MAVRQNARSPIGSKRDELAGGCRTARPDHRRKQHSGNGGEHPDGRLRISEGEQRCSQCHDPERYRQQTGRIRGVLDGFADRGPRAGRPMGSEP